ncbi:MAG: serine/threonine-protein phosphatase [Ruminococcus sp.]|nr:serine/threonine-protein phosphatase [Ruminococcus sp.]
MFIYSYVTTEGIVKKVNQDALMIKTARLHGKEILFAAVCDGIGGLSGGEDASSCVIKAVSDWFETECAELIKNDSDILEIRTSLDERLHKINDAINDECARGREMGTTFTSLLIDMIHNSVLVAHVGDTRLYRIYDKKLEIITSDHSIVAEEVRRGIISAESARFDKRQNQITNCIGAGETGRMYDFAIQSPEQNCVYMLCSDGFRKMVSPEELHQALMPSANPDQNALHSSLDHLLSLNIDRKESDNITALAVILKGDR